MNRKESSFVLFLLASVIMTRAQSDVKTIRGKITGDNADVTGIAVQNTTSKKATITDFQGNFSIQVQLNDTLVFSAVQLKRKVLPISKEVFNAGFITVPMTPFVNELREVVVQPYNLSGNLGTDAMAMEVAPVTASSLGLPNAGKAKPTQSERKLQEATTGMGLIPINPIINAITGRTKMLKNRVSVDKRYARTQAVEASILDSLFLNELKIPKQNIADFMYFCEVDSEFQQLVDGYDQLDLWAYMINRSKLYRRNNNLE